MNNDTPKTLSKVALDVDTVIQRGVREDCKDVGFNYDDKVNNAIYLLCVGEVQKTLTLEHRFQKHLNGVYSFT